MKLDCVFTAVNENKLYLDFIPIFIKTWNKLYPNVDVKIVLIAKEIPEDLIFYKNNIIIFKPIEDVLTSFTSQFIRLLYPCILDYKNGVLITDMDMLPMNSTYYTKNIVEFDNNKFIYYRDNVCFEFKEIAMCYNVATPIIWKDIFKVFSIDDIANVIKETFIKNTIKEGHGNTGWCTDQITLYNKIMEWNKKTNNFICLNEKQTLFKRLDRNTFDISNVNVRENITSGKYTDYHCYRPMSQYSKINWEIFNLLPSAYSQLPFIKSELKSPIGDGVFEIFINSKENILYKKIKKEINIINIENYKKIIYGLKSNPVLCEYIFEPEKIYIEDDGSYYSSFNKNSIRLYDINSNSKLDDTILYNLKRSIQDMKKKLNNYVKTNKLSGDWALHNLIYCLDTNKIYNVDLEGFYTYPLIHNNGNCDINYCNERFDKLLKDINLQEKVNDEYFTLILWNPTLFQSEKMIEDIPNIIEKKEIVVPKEFLHDYIFDIYKIDTRCSHNIVLPHKIKKLKEYNDNHLIVKFKIDNPQYTNNICNQAVKLKEMIRNKYKSNIKNYIKDIMIHVADNFEQSKYIWEKKTSENNKDNLNMVKLFVQEAKNPLRYKLSKKDKNGKDGWNTLNTMNVYENYIEGTIQYFVYRAANPRRYCLSMEKITDNNWEYYFDFYCKESDVDKRMIIYKINNKLNCDRIDKSKNYVTQRYFHKYCGKIVKQNDVITLDNDINNVFYIISDKLTNFMYDFFTSITYDFFIFFGTSDESFTLSKFSKLLTLPKLKYIYAQNYTDVIHDKIILLPIGLSDFRTKENYYNNEIVFNQSKKINKILISYHQPTNKVRSSLIKQINSKNVIVSEKMEHKDFVINLSKYKYSLCLTGNGFDTHRFWESIWLNTIPIVLKSDYYIDELYRNAGGIVLNNINELDSIFKTEPKYNTTNTELMCQQYWDGEISNKMSQFIENNCYKIITMGRCCRIVRKMIELNVKKESNLFDWTWTDKLSEINYILNKIKNNETIKIHIKEKQHLIDNTTIVTGHYPNNDYKKIFERRVGRFLSDINKYKKILFIRDDVLNTINDNEITEFYNIIKTMSSNLQFKVLLLTNNSIKDYEYVLKYNYNKCDFKDILNNLGIRIPERNIELNDNSDDEVIPLSLNNYNIITHKDCYNHILNTLNTNNIKFVIIRGFKYLPLKPDTDLDIIIHPDSYNKFIEIYSELKNDNLIRIQHPAKYIENDKEVFYTPLFTASHLKEGNHLPGNYYRFDTYSDLFFYKDGEGNGKNAIICNQLFKKYLFDNLIKIDNYYIPNPISEIILLIYRNLYDKRSQWSVKHINRINELLLSINKDEFNKICYYCFTSEQNIYEYLTAKEFNKINKPNQKLNLFIIRKKGMVREIIENILNQIENEYQILDKILININNKKKFYSNFYGNYDKHKDDIEKNNDNQCLAIITNNPDDINPNELKQKIRKQYIKFYPPLGNIIHSSDSSNDCEKELEMLFNENIDNFKNIGTYYSQKDI